VDINHPDYLSLRVLTTVLGGYFGSRLMKNVRETKGYTYHIGADLVTNTPQVFFLVHCEAQSGKADKVIEEVGREMLRLHTEPVSDEELRMVRNYMTGEICRNYESAFSLTDAYIFMDHLGLPQTHLERTLETIRTTDSNHLQQLAQHYLRPDILHSVVVTGT
jgi:predicted Zn-dependent peptidase